MKGLSLKLVAILTAAVVICNAGLMENSAVGAKSHRVGDCWNAITSVRRSSTTGIVFRVTCRLGAPNEEAGFFVTRLRPSGAAVGFRGFRHMLKLQSQSGSRHSGSCQRVHRSLSCVIKGRGVVTAYGELRVQSQSRCAARIAVTLFRSKSCHSEVCPSNAEVVSLFFGLPRGC